MDSKLNLRLGGSKMKKVKDIINKIASITSTLCFAGIIFIMLLTVGDIFVRFVFDGIILGAYEIVERSLFCIVFASFAYAQIHKGHVHVTMLVSLFPPKLRMFCLGVTGLLSAFMCFMLSYAASLQAQHALLKNYTTAVLKIKLYPFYWFEVITIAIFGLTVLVDAVQYFIAIYDPDMLASVDDFIG